MKGKHLAAREYHELVTRLRKLIRNSDEHSLRSLAAKSQEYDKPEAMHHTNLSEVLRLKPGRGLYLWQALVLCKLLGIHPAEWLCGRAGGLMAQALDKMTEEDRSKMLRLAADKVKDRPGAIGLRRQLLSAAETSDPISRA